MGPTYIAHWTTYDAHLWPNWWTSDNGATTWHGQEMVCKLPGGFWHAHIRWLLMEGSLVRKTSIFNMFRIMYFSTYCEFGTCGICSYGYFKISNLIFWKIGFFWKCMVLPVLGSPSPVRLCRSCLRRFGDLRKKHAPGLLKHASCGCCRCLSISYDFRVPPSGPGE